ncbi:MAG: quinol monooxygenase YgiN [Parasphingorhabdus sp.]|jgi:quinol monooxygenase YgiN
MSVTVLLETKAKPECVEELKTLFQNILPDTRAYDGCISVLTTCNQDDPLNVLLIETWETRAKYEAYLGWRSETGVVAAIVALLSEPPSIRYFDTLDI